MLSLIGIRAREAYVSDGCWTAIRRWLLLVYPGRKARKGSGQSSPKGGRLSIKKLSLTVIAVALCVAVAMTSIAAAGGAADTKVTIRGDNGDFHGKVFSNRLRCLGNRKVKVYKLTGDNPKPARDLLIASDTSERVGDHGVWSVGNTGRKNGKFYAHVNRKPNCKSDNSNVLTL
jgi:hypothetical protein